MLSATEVFWLEGIANSYGSVSPSVVMDILRTSPIIEHYMATNMMLRSTADFNLPGLSSSWKALSMEIDSSNDVSNGR